jgi:hypothetical protein
VETFYNAGIVTHDRRIGFVGFVRCILSVNNIDVVTRDRRIGSRKKYLIIMESIVLFRCSFIYWQQKPKQSLLKI